MTVANPSSTEELNAPLRLPLAGRALCGLAVVSIILAVWFFRGQALFTHPETILKAAADHAATASALFLLIYTVTTLAGIPTLPLNLAAGWLWGPLLGGVLSAIGAATGATFAFAAARTIFGQPLRRRFGNRFLAWVQAEFERKGWRFIVFVRLNPVFPSGPLNYVFGLSSIGARTYIWATAVALVLPSIAVAWIGDQVGHLRSGGDVGQMMRVAIGISAAVTALVGIRYIARYINDAKPGRNS